ncbi:MAG: hypothetical protein ACLQJ0_00115 [Steroidobacteraceae bacterium]|jgi:hypothetical protein
MTRQKITRDRVELNAVIKRLAAKSRPEAVAILAKYDALTAPEIKPEDIPAARAAFNEALARLDARVEP